MRELFAPWRIEYIRRPRVKGCFLCRMLRQRADRRSLILKRGATCFVIMNRYPYNCGHVMVCPKRHVDGMVDLTVAERLEMLELVDETLRVLTDHMRPDGYNVGVNLGSEAGAGLEEHLHMHVVPRWKGDANFMAVVADTRVLPQALTDMWDDLAPRFAAGTPSLRRGRMKKGAGGGG